MREARCEWGCGIPMKIRSLALASLLCTAAGAMGAQDESSALIDVLVCKKVLTPKEAECLKAELICEREKSSADKIRLSGPVTELKLYGDLRFRFQYDNVDPQVGPFVPDTDLVFDPVRRRFVVRDTTGFIDREHGHFLDPGHGDQRDRWRFRLRLNADFTLKDNWFGGVQLQTARTSDSANQTFDGGFQNYDIFISRAFVGWNAADWFTVVIGKQANPFYTTDLVWDPDINPSGLVETVRFHKLACCGEKETVTLAPDGKTVLSVTRSRLECPWTLTLVAGQFIFDDNQEFNPPGRNTDAYLFEEQLIASYKFCENAKLTFAPAYLRYNAAQVNFVWNQQGFAQLINGTGTDGLPPGWGETRDLSILQGPGDFAFTLCGWKCKVLWDVAFNTSGAKRINDIYVFPVRDRAGNILRFDPVDSHTKKDNVAWLVGLQIGDNVKKGDWAFYVNYRQVGLASVDPNLNDSDWAQSRLNMRGWKAALGYNFTDAVIGQITGSTADNLRPDLIGGQTTNGAHLADANSVQVLQVDLNVKF